MRWHRYLSFIFSLLLAVGIYGAMLYLAPQIILMTRPEAKAAATKPIQVTLRTEASLPAPAAATRVLATRPGTVSDLVKAEADELAPDTPLNPGVDELPEVARALASDAIPREHAVQGDAELARRADARILEIAAEDARRSLDVPRRLVRPSPDRLVPEGQTPTLRVAGADAPAALSLAPLGRSLLTESPTATTDGPLSAPPIESGVAGAVSPPLPEMPALPPQLQPAAQSAEQAKQQSAYTFLDDLLDLKLDVYQPEPEKPGWFRLRILPRADVEMKPTAKALTYVVDASKSIPQHKLRATAKAVKASFSLLRPEDSFNVIVFRNDSVSLRPAPEPASDALKAEAAKLLDGLEAKGETDVYQALAPLAQLPAPSGYPSVLLLFTDGRPTTGVQDGRTIINSVTTDNALKHPIYAYAAGNSVNRPLLDLLAYRNQGRAHVVEDVNQVEKQFPQLMSALRDPLLVDCKAEFLHLDPATVFPRNPADLYAAQPITLFGQFDPAKTAKFIVRITGRAGETPKEVIFETAFKEAQSADASVAQGWAFEKAYHLIGEISRQGETPELLADLRALSQQYGITTSYD